MIVNLKTFQEIIIKKQNSYNQNCCLTINSTEIKPKESVTLLGTETDNKFSFEKHVSTICKNVTNQLKAIHRTGMVIG